jgi:hypothetical protein
MSRHFTLPTMLRMTPNNLLHQFFQRLGHTLPAIDWLRLRDRQVQPLLSGLACLSREAQEQIESALASIFELSCERGWQAILDAARQFGEAEPAQRFPDRSSAYARAMWTWLHRPEVFDHALMMHEVEGLARWRKRTGLPILEPRITSDTVRELGIALSKCLRREEGRGHNCTVEYYRRRDGADVFVAYPDDFVRTVMAHDKKGRLLPRSVHQTFEIVFAYQSENGTLELFAKVAPLVKPKLECLFGQIILGADLGPKAHTQPFNLNRLKDRYFCLETDPHDRVSVSIKRLRLDVPQRGRLTVEPDSTGRGGDVYEVIDDCLNDEAVSWDDVKISLATFYFRFEGRPGSKPSTLKFDVAYPDRCSIKSSRPERIEMTRKYLRRWRIANV